MLENKRKTIRKVSMVLIAVVVVSMLAFAGAGAAANTWIVDDNTGTYHKTTIADAISAASAGDTIQLGMDVIGLSSTINISKNITIDLYGHVLQTTCQVFSINSNCTLTVDDTNPEYGEDEENHQGYCNSDGVWNWKSKDTEKGFTELHSIKGGIITSTCTNANAVLLSQIGDNSRKFVLNGGTIAGIHSNQDGGLIRLEGGGIFEMNGGAFYGNSTDSDVGGGLINMKNATVTINGGTLENNVAYVKDTLGTIERSGGGIIRVDSFDYSCLLNINGGQFIGNKTKWSSSVTKIQKYQPEGGVIFIFGSIAKSDPSNYKCEVNISGNVLFEGNEAPKGGVISMIATQNGTSAKSCFNGTMLLTIKANSKGTPTFINNKALSVTGDTYGESGKGGAIFMGVSTNVGIATYPLLKVEIDGAIIGCEEEISGEMTKEGNTAVNGGAIYMDLQGKAREGSNLTIKNVQIEYNTATANGGAIYLSDGLMNIGGDSTIAGNTAVNGGAIYMAAGTMTISDTVKIGTDGNANTATTDGGGIYMTNGTMTITGGDSDGVSISSNAATNGSGGGIYLGGGTMSVNGITSILSNKASNGNGGGVYVGNGDMTVENIVTIDANKAKNGGGIYMNLGTMTITGGTEGSTTDSITISSNEATADGGGVYLKGNDDTELNISGITNIKTNKAPNGSGGGIYQDAGTFTAVDSMSVISNEAKNGGGVYVGNGTMIIEDTVSVGSNKASQNGGGIYMDQGTMTVTGGTESSTTDSITISSNEATTDGGGVYVGNGDMTINGRTNIMTNKSANGGGIYLGGNNLTLNDTTIITTNEATNGGGVYVSDGTMIVGNDSLVMNNKASQNGGGIYQTSGTLTVKDDVLIGSGNTAENNGGGIYLDNGTMSIEGNVNVLENKAKYMGGGIYMNYGYLSMSDNVYVIDNVLTESSNPSSHGSGFYIGNPNGVTLKDDAKFSDKDELYIESLENCKEGDEKVGIIADNWTGEIAKLGLNQTQFEGFNVVVFSTRNDGEGTGPTGAAAVAKRARLSNEEKWTLKNVYINTLTSEETEMPHTVYAVLNYPRIVDATFKSIKRVTGTAQGDLQVAYVISDDNTADWYYVQLYYSDKNPEEGGTWTLLNEITPEQSIEQMKKRMYDEKTGEEIEIEKGGHYDNSAYMTFHFDGTTDQKSLRGGYYGIKVVLGKDIVSGTTGKPTDILNRLYMVTEVPIIEGDPTVPGDDGQPEYQYNYLVEDPEQKTEGGKVEIMAVRAKDWTGGDDVTYQWYFSEDGKVFEEIDKLFPGFLGAKTNKIYPTTDGEEKSEVMSGYYKCLITDNTGSSSNDANDKASIFSITSQVVGQYRIYYYNNTMVLEDFGLLPDRYTKYDLPEDKTLPTVVEIPGLDFFGWYTDETLTTPISVIPEKTEGVRKIYGLFDLKRYYLKLNVNDKGVWKDGGKEERGGKDQDEKLYVNVGTKKLDRITVDDYVPHSVGSRASVTTFDGWSVGPDRYSPIVIDADGNVVPDVVVGGTRYTTKNGEWVYTNDDYLITLYAHWVWPDPVVYLQSLGGDAIELSKVKVEVTNEAGEKFVYKSPKNDPSVGEFLEAGEKLNLAYGVDPVNGYFPDYDGWGVGHGEKVRVHVIYNNQHTLFDQEVMAK